MDGQDGCGNTLQQKLDSPVKWIGMYIAAASAVCTLAMAADVFHGLRTRNLWFPNKYFSLNATFLTLLAVAMKPPMDLSDQLYQDAGFYAKISSLIFMCTAMVNFLSSLGSMNDQMILTNTIALGILALTVVGNMLIQLVQLRCYIPFPLNIEFLDPTICILVLLVILVSSAITAQNIKRTLEMKYKEMHKAAMRQEYALTRNERFTISNQREEMKKYWVMAETSNPQFVMARSVISTTSSVICWLATITFGEPSSGIFFWMPIRGIVNSSAKTVSAYKWSSRGIQAIQSIGALVGLVAPTLRWFNNVNHKCSNMSYKSFGEEFSIENYWTETLVDWRDNSVVLRIRHDKCRRCFHTAKWLIMNICIGVQIFVVLISKVIVVLSVILLIPFFACFTRIKKLKASHTSKDTKSNDHVGVEIGDRVSSNLSRYVLLLEGEPQLPKTTVKRINHQADKVIQAGIKRQPKDLIKFLHKSDNFHGVRNFDNIEVSSLHSQEPRNCWTLPLVTLTSVAVALPNVANDEAKQLLSSVSEGVSLAKLVDETLDANGELANMRKAAKSSWTRVELHHKWQDLDLRKTSFRRKKSKEVLELFSTKAESIVREFNREVMGIFMENPLNWPTKVIAANSMYRICQSILLSIQGENEPTDNELFEQLNVIIADIFAACLTNLPHVIRTMCHEIAIEKREKSVREAFLLLGKTECILEYLQQREWPSDLDPCYNKALSIDEWRAFLQQYGENTAALASASSNETEIAQSPCEEHLEPDEALTSSNEIETAHSSGEENLDVTEDS